MCLTYGLRAAISAALLWCLTDDAYAAKKWRVKPDCTLIENKANDGDSFHVRVNRRHYIFRLYWVDAPETDMSSPERVAEQARYFGTTQARVIEAGKEAKRFAEEFLKGSFTVHTKFADAMGRSKRDRDYAIIEKDGKYLHQELVAAGLARIHGFQEVADDMPNHATMRSRLTYAESEAKKAGRGAWGGGGSSAWSNAGASPSSPQSSAADFTPNKFLPKALTLSRSVIVYDTEDSSRQLGTLRSGSRIEILGEQTAVMIRIRFQAGETEREGLCHRSVLGI